jgi:hypothetical protein
MHYALSGMAGIACQLLKSPACKLSNPNSSSLNGNVPALHIRMPLLDDPSSDLAAGDCLARLIPRHDKAESRQHHEETSFIFVFEQCQENDANALFVNRLFGSRGETPTTIVQWSKGTIF